MPAHVRGFVVCDGEDCNATVTVVARVASRGDHPELWWDLPEGWQLYARRHGGSVAFCSSRCNKQSATMGHPDFTGKRHNETTYDVRTLDKLYELIEIGAKTSSDADNVLAAIEAVLLAWRQRPSKAS